MRVLVTQLIHNMFVEDPENIKVVSPSGIEALSLLVRCLSCQMNCTLLTLFV